MEPDLKALLERGVVALEKLNEDPVIQVETKPPVCPHCERVNPVVFTREDEGTGAMAEIVYRFECQHCKNPFYAIPLQWQTAMTTREAEMVVRERIDFGGYQG